ncbi:MAG: hypothetical protein M1832_000552 [Thelocarpon impressellum]|nr:MAG: hypothetical protein M1832_000552 [Thelocarpon impressellum]
MLPAPDEACDDGCTLAGRGARPAALLLSLLPFVLTFVGVGVVVLHRLFPLLSGQARGHGELRMAGPAPRPLLTARHIAAVTFSVTVALAAVLAELILCEISNSLDRTARARMLQLTLPTLLALLIVVIPLLEIHSLVTAAGWTFSGDGKGRPRLAWLLETLGFGAWAGAFWWLGRWLPGSHTHERSGGLSAACLERVGVIGICLMGLLSGFASVSSPWQNFGGKARPVTEADVERSQAGLLATTEMLAAKHSRLRALERKMADAPAEGIVGKVMGSLRGNADAQERRALGLELSGLETMRAGLELSLAGLRERRRRQQRSTTSTGRLVAATSPLFSLYCLYRIAATSVATLRRWWRPDATFAGGDPINNVLALLAKHWDPSLDRLAWSRQISFLLSGVILLASFSSVLQTFLFFSRLAPGLLQAARANLALLVGQISATYVISSALLLRSSLPSEVGSVVADALGGAPLDPAFADRWFEGWFLTASALTAAGLVLGRRFGGDGEDDYGEADLEPGDKRS